MSSRSSSELITPITSLVDECRRAAALPVLERLRFFERLQPLDVGQVRELIAAVDLDADSSWIPRAFAQLVPPIYWLTRSNAGADDDGADDHSVDVLEELVTWRLGERWIAILLGALTTGLPPLPTLSRLHGRIAHQPSWLSLFEQAWPRITQLASHPDIGVRCEAAQLALVGSHITPAVTAALGELLEALADSAGDEDYDHQVFGEALLTEIAKVGPLLSALGPRIDRLLGSPSAAFRAAAAQAAGALGEPSLIAVLESNQRLEAVPAVRAMMRFALWQLTGELSWLGCALDDAEDRVVNTFRIFQAFDNATVDDQLLAGLAYAARRPAWHKYACDVLAKIGPPAAATVAQLPPPPDDDPATLSAFHHARWRAGLLDDAGFVAALQPLLGSGYQWRPYVETGLATPVWRATIRAAIEQGDNRAALEALAAAPSIAVQFLPDLIAARRDAVIEHLWYTLPRETFWAHVNS
ncbi:MAG TPA: hypothetical protein VIV40_22920 [Kofleriaceae bacterium]